MSTVATVTHPIETLIAQLAEVRDGNAATREEIARLRRLLERGEAVEAKMNAELERLLSRRKVVGDGRGDG